MYINAQQFILCIVLPTQYIIPPHYHNTNHVLHRLYVINSNTKDCQMQYVIKRLSSFNFNKILTEFCHLLMDWLARNNDALFIHIDMWELCSVISNDSPLTFSFGIIVYHPLVRLSHSLVWSGSCLGIRRTGQLEGTLFERAHLNQGTSTGRLVFRTHRGIGFVTPALA